MLEKINNLRYVNQVRGYEFIWDSITNTTDSTNIRQDKKTFLGVFFGTRRNRLMEKNSNEKLVIKSL